MYSIYLYNYHLSESQTHTVPVDVSTVKKEDNSPGTSLYVTMPTIPESLSMATTLMISVPGCV